jgi:monofunctional biosynthetic peptidoglycan transglycosylase
MIDRHPFPTKPNRRWRGWRGWHRLGRPLGVFVLVLFTLQGVFALRIALMTMLNPESTTFQRSEAWRLLRAEGRMRWRQQWVDYDHISPHLKRAVIASEDAGFAEHSGVEWDAIESAWERNLRAEAVAARANARAERREAEGGSRALPRSQPRIVGGSTITQQLAKNLFLSGERSVVRKAQEFVLTLMLEALLTKQRILEIYLNSVEWGEGVFGAQAAARHYFGVDAQHLSPVQAARLAVMLPAPKRFEKRPGSAYVTGRAATIVARMPTVELP